MVRRALSSCAPNNIYICWRCSLLIVLIFTPFSKSHPRSFSIPLLLSTFHPLLLCPRFALSLFFPLLSSSFRSFLTHYLPSFVSPFLSPIHMPLFSYMSCLILLPPFFLPLRFLFPFLLSFPPPCYILAPLLFLSSLFLFCGFYVISFIAPIVSTVGKICSIYPFYIFLSFFRFVSILGHQ